MLLFWGYSKSIYFFWDAGSFSLSIALNWYCHSYLSKKEYGYPPRIPTAHENFYRSSSRGTQLRLASAQPLPRSPRSHQPSNFSKADPWQWWVFSNAPRSQVKFLGWWFHTGDRWICCARSTRWSCCCWSWGRRGRWAIVNSMSASLAYGSRKEKNSGRGLRLLSYFRQSGIPSVSLFLITVKQ